MKNKTLGNMSTVLMIGSVMGVIATSISAAMTAPKANEKLRVAENNKEDDLTTLDTVKVLLPAYAPSIILGASTIACIIGSNVANKKQLASLSAAVAVGGKYVHQYKGKIREMFGSELDRTIDDEIKVEHPEDTIFTYDEWMGYLDNSSDDNPGTPMLFYDVASGIYFEKTLEQVLLSEYHLNRDYVLNGEVTMDDWWFYLGLDVPKSGNDVIWTPMDADEYWIDFAHVKRKTEEGAYYYEINIITEPYNIDMAP